MTDAVIISIVAQIPIIVGLVLTWSAARRTERLSKKNLELISDNTHKTIAVEEKLNKVSEDIDGHMSNLLRITAESEKAKGIIEGKAIEKAKNGSEDVK